jgi:DNA-binding response OmpR family regulator
LEVTPIAKKVLFVDDEPGYSRAMTYTLEKEGYEVVSASNGLQALMKAQKENPDLIILDVMLPGMDGFEVCSRLRNDPQTSPIPIIMLSAKGQDADKSTGLRVGALDYLTKPVENTTLMEKIQVFLQQ